MKNLIILTALVSAFFVTSCTQTSKTAGDEKTHDKLIDSTCYGAAFDKDEAHMVLKNYASGKVGGTLDVNYEKNSKNTGTLDGRFKGDTLYVDYRFTSGTETVHTNPLAFLKKDGKFIMGVGQIETTLGRSYFVKDKPINFEVGKFTFQPANCK